MYLTNFVLTVVIVVVAACATASDDSCPGGDCRPACTDPAGCSPPQVCASDAACPGGEFCMVGACVAASNVAWLTPTGSDRIGAVENTSCAEAAPCRTAQHVCTLGHPWARMAGDFQEPMVFDHGCDLKVVATPGTTLKPAASDAVAITIADSETDVEIHDLLVWGGTDRNTDAIKTLESRGAPKLSLVNVTVAKSAGIGVRVAGGSLTMDGCTITGSKAGGLMITGATSFQIRGGEITSNGSATSTQGGIWISANAMDGNLIDSVTVSNNQADPNTAAPGIDCTAAGTVISRTKVTGNGPSDTTTQVAGNCTFQ